MSGTNPGDWWVLAACQAADPELFFPISEAGAGQAQLAQAKAICAACTVRQLCLDYAVQSRQLHGVWGGTSEEARRPLIRRQSAPARQADGRTQRSARHAGASGRTPTGLRAG